MNSKTARSILKVWKVLKWEEAYGESDTLREVLKDSGYEIKQDGQNYYLQEIPSFNMLEKSLQKDKDNYINKLIKLERYTQGLLVKDGFKEHEASHIIDKVVGDVK